MENRSAWLAVTCVSLSLAGSPSSMGRGPSPDAGVRGSVVEAYGKLPLTFEANRGQVDPQVQFLSRGPGYSLFLTARGATLAFIPPDPGERREGPRSNGMLARRHTTGAVLRMALVGAHPDARVAGGDEQAGQANYFVGSDPTRWRTGVPRYARVHYQDVYPGIDLVYYGRSGRLEYDFAVRPGSDPGSIGLRFEGADSVEVDESGDLVLGTAAGAIRQRKPFIYQDVDGRRHAVPGGYALRARGQIGFEIGPYDRSRPLTIDPVLVYSTYLGGSDVEQAVGIAVDALGQAYVTGETLSTDFPTTEGAFQTVFGGVADVFVAKLDPTGSSLAYSTYLGGSANDQARGIAVDPLGRVYLTGFTVSSDFPVTAGAFDTTANGSSDAFVAQLDAAGSGLLYSTYLGGSDLEFGVGIAVDGSGSAYVSGMTNSSDFPTTPGAFDTTANSLDGFVTKLNTTGDALEYSTYLGGSGPENNSAAGGIAVDALGNAYVTGTTVSTDFPTTPGAFDTTFNGPVNVFDAFVSKLNSTGSALVYSTYLGGSAADVPLSVAVDALGRAFVTGLTNSADFPTTAGAFDTTLGGTADAFVTRLNLTGSLLDYSTYLGGGGGDLALGIAVDGVGHAYVTGFTGSADFPTTAGALDTTLGGTGDAFLTAVTPTGATLSYSSYLGGSGGDLALGIALDGFGNAYLAGDTNSTDFPTTPGAFDTTANGNLDGFVTRVAVLPIATQGKVTGWGSTNVANGTPRFHFSVARELAGGPVTGSLWYRDQTGGARVKATAFASLSIIGHAATFSGTCVKDGIPCTFSVEVTDERQLAAADTFVITVSGNPPVGGPLQRGDIRIHPVSRATGAHRVRRER